MLKKTITYIDFNEVERTEDFYFNLTQAEVTEMELSEKGGMVAVLEKIIAEQNMPKVMEFFKHIIDFSYGEKSTDGRKFVKSPEVLDEFKQTVAYSELFMELATDADKAAVFVNGIMPEPLQPVGESPKEAALTKLKEREQQIKSDK